LAYTLDPEWLTSRLSNSDLDIYTVVPLARRDLSSGRVSDAIARLRSEADKLRVFDKELVAALLGAAE